MTKEHEQHIPADVRSWALGAIGQPMEQKLIPLNQDALPPTRPAELEAARRIAEAIRQSGSDWLPSQDWEGMVAILIGACMRPCEDAEITRLRNHIRSVSEVLGQCAGALSEIEVATTQQWRSDVLTRDNVVSDAAGACETWIKISESML